MLTLETIPANIFPNGLCATIGNFDGVHLGHRQLIKQALQSALARNLNFAAITFWPHPRTVLADPAAHRPLSSRQRRRELFAEAGVPILIELPFTSSFAAISAPRFIKEYLVPARLRHLVIGHDFNFGHNREGTIEMLEKLGRQNGFGIAQLAPVKESGHIVSSSRLRKLLEAGKVAEAAGLLGYNYAIDGIVEHGEARGRKLGFPTANLGNVETLIPADGVYATIAHLDGKKYGAITNIGMNPTFSGARRTIETFLLDASGDFYGDEMRLEFIQRLRDERKFANPAELSSQIENDVMAAKAISLRLLQ